MIPVAWQMPGLGASAGSEGLGAALAAAHLRHQRGEARAAVGAPRAELVGHQPELREAQRAPGLELLQDVGGLEAPEPALGAFNRAEAASLGAAVSDAQVMQA